MRIFAIIVNLIQMGMILTIFLVQGLKLGGPVILVFFLMLLFAFVNLLVLLFYTVNMATNSPIIGEEKPGIVKRQDLRVSYRSDAHPTLIIDGQRFSVLDVAENGVRFSIPRNQRIKKRVRVQLTLLSGDTLTVRGSLARREGNEATLMFKKPLSFETLATERRSIQNP